MIKYYAYLPKYSVIIGHFVIFFVYGKNNINRTKVRLENTLPNQSLNVVWENVHAHFYPNCEITSLDGCAEKIEGTSA